MNDAEDGVSRYPHSICNGALGNSGAMQTANFAHLIRRQLGLAVFTAVVILAAVFTDHVGVVVGGAPQKQMLGIHASPVVASVQHVKVSDERPMREFVGHAMRADRSTGFKLKLAVAMNVERSGPIPAPALRSIDESKKAVRDGRALLARTPLFNGSVALDPLIVGIAKEGIT